MLAADRKQYAARCSARGTRHCRNRPIAPPSSINRRSFWRYVLLVVVYCSRRCPLIPLGLHGARVAEPASTVSRWSRCAFGARRSRCTTCGPTAAGRPPTESRPRASLRAGSAIASSRARTWDVHRQRRHERDFERSDQFDGKVVSVRFYRFYCLILRTQRGYAHIVTLCIARVLL